jgi:hypothetical protein
MPNLEYVEAKEFAPKAWGAACELLGGEERVVQPITGATALLRTWASAPTVHGSRHRPK